MKVYDQHIGHANTGRGLADLGDRIGPGTVEAAIARRLADRGSCRVLEIGCGEGRALMELRALFSAAEFHGINEAPWPAMRGSDSLPAIAEFFRIPPPDAADVALPTIHFGSAADLPLPADHVDVIFSQATFHFVRHKARALEDVARVLVPGGVAHVHLDSTGYRDRPCPRFVIDDDGPGRSALDHVSRGLAAVATVAGRRVAADTGGWFTIVDVAKTRAGAARLGLSLDDARSGLLGEAPMPARPGYGYLSVYRRDGRATG